MESQANKHHPSIELEKRLIGTILLCDSIPVMINHTLSYTSNKQANSFLHACIPASSRGGISKTSIDDCSHDCPLRDQGSFDMGIVFTPWISPQHRPEVSPPDR
jgi:hypothetical protein